MSDKQKEQKFKELLTDNKEMIYRLCYAYLYSKNEVEDLFQEVMISIWNSIESFRNESKVSTWVYRVVVNTALMYNKKDKRVKSIIKNTESINRNAADDFTEYIEKEERILKLRKAIIQLEKQDRLIISLVLEGMKYEEISEIMGITLSNVGVKINRIKSKLFILMKEYNG